MALVACVALTSCSLLFVDAPSAARTPRAYPNCDEGRGIPSLDVAFGALFGGFAVIDGVRGVALAGVAIEAFLGVLYVGSAVRGFQKVSECREARNGYRERIENPLPNAPATEGELCHPSHGCELGLVCASKRCVRFTEPAE
jgi:hypothetical protein